MEVIVEDLGSLKRKLSITVPKENVAKAYDRCYNELKGKIRVNGFRPGKFPRTLMEKRFKEVMKKDALEHLIPEYFQKALEQETLETAASPDFDSIEIERKKPLKFTATFEIVPKVDIPDWNFFQLEKKEVVVTTEDLEKRKQVIINDHATYETKEGAVEDSDMVVLDYEGKLDGEVIQEASKKEASYILGENQLIPGFGENLIGLAAHDTKIFSVEFSADIQQEVFQNKTIEFSVQVHEVKKKISPTINRDFFQKFDEKIETEKDFDQWVKDVLKQEQKNQFQQEYRDSITEQIKQITKFDVPKSLLEKEIEHKIHMHKQHPPHDHSTHAHDHDEQSHEEENEEDLKERFTDESKKLLQLYYFLEKIRKQENIELDKNAAKSRFVYQSYLLRQNPQDFIQTDFGRQFYQEVEGQVIRESVLDYLVEKVLDT